MAVLQTSDLVLPDQILDPWLLKVKYGSSVAALSNSIPMKFGKGHSMAFDIGEAEYVAEGGNKGPTTISKTTPAVGVFKFHKTVRWSDEVMFADDDYQLGVVTQVLNLIQPALSRALDFGVFHGINPTGGAAVAAMAANLSTTANSVEYAAADKPYVSLDAADALVLAGGFIPRDVALDPVYASKFGGLRGTTSEQKMYPDFRYATAVSDLDGHRASVSNTVGAVGVAAVPTTALGFVGNFDTIGWGIQRAIGLEVIEYGDPDGQGDLKRVNQVAFRAEIIYGWGFADLDAIAKVIDAV